MKFSRYSLTRTIWNEVLRKNVEIQNKEVLVNVVVADTSGTGSGLPAKGITIAFRITYRKIYPS